MTEIIVALIGAIAAIAAAVIRTSSKDDSADDVYNWDTDLF